MGSPTSIGFSVGEVSVPVELLVSSGRDPSSFDGAQTVSGVAAYGVHSDTRMGALLVPEGGGEQAFLTAVSVDVNVRPGSIGDPEREGNGEALLHFAAGALAHNCSGNGGNTAVIIETKETLAHLMLADSTAELQAGMTEMLPTPAVV